MIAFIMIGISKYILELNSIQNEFKHFFYRLLHHILTTQFKHF